MTTKNTLMSFGTWSSKSLQLKHRQGATIIKVEWETACSADGIGEAARLACIFFWKERVFPWENILPRLEDGAPQIWSAPRCLVIAQWREPVARVVSALYYCRKHDYGEISLFEHLSICNVVLSVFRLLNCLVCIPSLFLQFTCQFDVKRTLEQF